MVRRSALRTVRQFVPLLFAISLLVNHRASAQSFDATRLTHPSTLDAKWLVQAGDDLDYARPDFDDSHWLPFDPHNSVDATLHARPPVIWYRLHVKTDPAATLALSEVNLARAFEIYVNGEPLIRNGSVDPFVPYTPSARIIESVPQRMVATAVLVIAIRVRISPVEWASQLPGLYIDNLVLGHWLELNNSRWLDIIGANSVEWINRLLLVGLGLIAFVLFAAQRRQTVYLWIAAVSLLTLAEFPVPFITAIQNIPAYWPIIGTLPRLISPYIWVSLYFAFVDQRLNWVWRIILIIAGIGNFLSGIQGWGLALLLPLQFFSNLPYIIILSVVIPVVLAIHWRRGNREAGILLIPVILFSLYIYVEVGCLTLFQFPAWRQTALGGLNLIDHYQVGPFTISLNSISGILSTLSLAIIMLRRSVTMSRRQALLDAELEAAREVQRILVPEHRGTVPGFSVETAYEPAQQVGGDFFQFTPTPDGGLLIVVGDVAGKGLPAAMLVSVLVGAICGLTEYTQNPAELLAGLNERLVGRSGGGFSTAVAAHFAASGSVTLCNAGHLSPYLDGREVQLPGALPLGVAPSTQYETIMLRLDAGSRLTFYSDGVVEAQSPNGELFGFERARDISTQPAATIVEAARHFGQQDDITVVAITRTTAVATAA